MEIVEEIVAICVKKERKWLESKEEVGFGNYSQFPLLENFEVNKTYLLKSIHCLFLKLNY